MIDKPTKEETSEFKIEALLKKIKNKLVKGESINTVFYLLDDKSSLHALEINEKFLLEEEKQSILKQLVKEKVNDLKKDKNLEIEKILYIKQGYYNINITPEDKINMDLDKDFNKSNSNEALILTIEDTFNFNIKIFDCISGIEEGKKFSVLSKEPIDNIEFCKLDPDYNIKTTYINLLE